MASRLFPARKKSLRSSGDKARDIRDWLAAENEYKRYLKVVSDDHAIWTQLGHALKEQGKFEEAEQAYLEALKLSPDDADTSNHLAHLLKRVGKVEAAVNQFVSLFQATGLREVHTEIVSLKPSLLRDSRDMQATRTVQNDALFIEIDDLLGFLEAHKTVSGIQRVQLGVIQHVLSGKALSVDVRFVLNELGSTFLWQVDFDDLKQIVNYLQQADVSHAHLRLLVAKVRQNAVAVLARKGHAYLVLGAFWGYGAVAARYARLKRLGVTIGAYIYDLIPITHTEFCDEGLPHEFKLSFGDGLAIFDFFLAISEFSATEIRKYIERMRLPPKPVVAVPLAHADASPAPAPARGAKNQKMVARKVLAVTQGKPFAMMVSTIEARKNHAYLVAAWKAFLDEGLDPPDLVFVGRPGWRVTSLMEMLATTRYLDGRVHILHDLSDIELTTLYDACLFTLFPSFVEGWGLPVGESLARGKPCVASSTSAVPEVGGDFVDYVDPLNLRAGLEVIRRMAFDADYRNQRTQQIVNQFKLRTWADVGANLLAEVETVRHKVTTNTSPDVLFPSATIFRPSELALGNRLPETYARHPLRCLLESGWYGVEAMGCWMQGNEGVLQFRTDLEPGTQIVVYLGLYSPGFASSDLKLTVTVEGASTAGDHSGRVAERASPWVPMRVGQHFIVMAYGAVDQSNLVVIRIKLMGTVLPEAPEAKSREFAIGMSYICYAPAADAQARLKMIEQHLLAAMNLVR